MSRAGRLQVVCAGVAALAVIGGWTIASALGVQVLRAESDSMAPTVQAGDVVVATATDDIARGDVVVFNDPGGWAERVARVSRVPAVAPTFVKRVVGLPGERVVCCDADGRITVDGDPILDDHRAEPDALASVLAFDVEVPADALFVLGDNRGVSVDSRYLGPVPLHEVLAVERIVLALH